MSEGPHSHLTLDLAFDEMQGKADHLLYYRDIESAIRSSYDLVKLNKFIEEEEISLSSKLESDVILRQKSREEGFNVPNPRFN